MQADGNQFASAVYFHIHQWQGNTQILHHHGDQFSVVALPKKRKTEKTMSVQIQLLPKAERGGRIVEQPVAVMKKMLDLPHGKIGVGIIEHVAVNAGTIEHYRSSYSMFLYEPQKAAGITARDKRNVECPSIVFHFLLCLM